MDYSVKFRQKRKCSLFTAHDLRGLDEEDIVFNANGQEERYERLRGNGYCAPRGKRNKAGKGWEQEKKKFS